MRPIIPGGWWGRGPPDAQTTGTIATAKNSLYITFANVDDISRASIRSIPSLVACPLCSETSAVSLSTSDGKSRQYLHTVACRQCTLVRVDPMPSVAELNAYYRDAYRTEYKGAHTPKLKHVWRAAHAALSRLEWVGPLLQPAKGEPNEVLDIGSGGGEWVALLAARGWRAAGLEPNRGYAEFSRAALGVNVTTGTIWDTEVAQRYGTLTAFHVLEHLPDPVAALRRLASRLRPGGRLVVEVPNILYAGGAPGNTFFRAHLFHFSPETLVQAGRAAGLAAVWTGLRRDESAIQIAFEADATRSAASSVQTEASGLLEEVLAANRRRTWRHYALSREAPLKLARRLGRIVSEAGLERRFATHAELLAATFGTRTGGQPPQR